MKLYLDEGVFEINTAQFEDELKDDGMTLVVIYAVGEVVTDRNLYSRVVREVWQLNGSANGSIYTPENLTLEFIRSFTLDH